MTNLPISLIASKVIENLEKTLKNSPTGVSFVSINGYTNSKGEVSNVLINVGVNYGNVKAKDLNYLQNLNVDTVNIPTKIGEAKRREAINSLNDAKDALIASQIAPSVTRSNGQKNAYTRLSAAPQIKVHNESGKIYIEGYQVNKKVLVKGTYKEVNSRPLTIAKNAIKEGMKVSKIRQYSLTEIKNMTINKNTLEFKQNTI